MTCWHEEWLPQLTATRDRLRIADPEEGSPATLLALLDEVEAITREDWLIHFRIVWPSMLAMQRFDELYADLFGDASAADGHEMLVGQPGTSVLEGVALSDLAASARAAGLADLVTAAAPKDVPSLLAASDAGRGLAEAIEDYLDRFGLQQDLFDYLLPTWQEDPAIVVGLLQGYLRSDVDARADHDATVCRANGALGAARARVAGYPAAVRAEFEAAVAAARAAYYLHLEHNVFIDQQGTSLTRRVLLKIGERLVEAGALSRPEDVFVLSYDELRALVAAPADRHVARRRTVGRTRPAAGDGGTGFPRATAGRGTGRIHHRTRLPWVRRRCAPCSRGSERTPGHSGFARHRVRPGAGGQNT